MCHDVKNPMSKFGQRISFHVYNTLEDVQAVLQVLEENFGLLAATKSIWGVMSQSRPWKGP